MSRSKTFFDSSEFNSGLMHSSPNQTVALMRQNVYKRVMENEQSYRDLLGQSNPRYFSSQADMAPAQMGVALREVSLKAYINSFVGYIAVERPMTQMVEKQVYYDIVTKAGASVMPMIGADNPRSRAESNFSANFTVGTKALSCDLNNAVVPGSIMIVATINGTATTITDDRKGNLLAAANVLSAGTVNYDTGNVSLTAVATPIAGDKVVINFTTDKVLAQGTGRTKPKQGYFDLVASVNKFEYEFDLISAAISAKTLGTDVQAKMKDSVYNEQVLAINNRLVSALDASYAGTTLTIDLSAFSVAGGFYDTLLNVFVNGLTSVDTALASRTYKAVTATAYIVGQRVGNLFSALDSLGIGWVPNNTGYVNGLLGFYNSRAVIRSLILADNEAYAIHKTPDGELAPVAYGILLPATDLPVVSNFSNVNEVAGGIYSVDGAVKLATELSQRFVVSLPSDWMVVA